MRLLFSERGNHWFWSKKPWAVQALTQRVLGTTERGLQPLQKGMRCHQWLSVPGKHPICFCHLPYGMERNFRDRFSKYLKNNCFSHFSSLPDNKGKRMQGVHGKERAEIAVRQVNWKSLSELWKGSNTEVVLQQVATQHKHIPPQQHIL